ncbi:MAG: hypothetical protein IJJ41_09575 [Clostridia bacterium]|nr:hypothetical protein [Clostridia bacterium]
MIQCTLNVADKHSMYMEQIVAGFTLLQKQGKVTFAFSEKPQLAKEFYHSAIIELLIGGKRVIYDLTDGYNNFPTFSAIDEMLDNVDIYYKASIREEFHRGFRNAAKIKVLAPRYRVTCSSSPLNKIAFGSILRGDTSEAKRLLRKLPFVKNAQQNWHIKEFEAQPIVGAQPKVFFYTRLWDPAIASGYSSVNTDLDGTDVEERIRTKSAEYEEVSALRAGLVRTLKKELGASFIGGVAPDAFSEKYCPDLVGGVNMSSRKDYTRNLQSAEICVNTQGTHHCWNFSFGEELAAARAIITEKPFYQTPDYLEEGVNFYTYDSIETCVEKAVALLEDRQLLENMMVANHDYYQNHLRPDKLVWDTIKDFAE